MKIKTDSSNLEKCLPKNISPQKKDEFKTLFYSKMALAAQVRQEMLMRKKINALFIESGFIKKPSQKLTEQIFKQTLKEVL